MHCPQCQHANNATAKFCEQCGTRLVRTCANCSQEVSPTAKFCPECGTSLSGQTASLAAASAPTPDLQSVNPSPQPYTPKHLADKILTSRSALEGERKQVSVLFADVADFTALSEKLDPEEVHQIINHCFELIATEVHKFEGTINQYTGDGVMALFGAPIAHEDGPRRAVHAALAIQDALRTYSGELQAQRGFNLQMRIGLNTGMVVVGKIGDDLRMDYTAVGDTTNLAARLEQTAQPGTVVISEATQKSVSGFFDVVDLGQRAVKGHTPVHVFEVHRARGQRTRIEVAEERGLTPLVGRERELATLQELFQQVKAGNGQAVSISGEAGIGKSRLLLEFRRALAQAGEEVLWREGRCISFGQGMPFLPLVEQMRQGFRIEEFDGEPEIIAKVEHGLRRIGDLEEHIPYVRYLLGVDPGDPAVTAMEAAARRKRMLDAMYALTLRSARIRPVISVIEDLHWIDRSTEESLGLVVDATAGLPLMFLFTYRVGYTPPLESRSFHTTLTLQSLPEADSLAMAGHVLGMEQFPDELKSALMEKAEGVPLFVEEVTKTLLDLGALQETNGSYRTVKNVAEVSVPETVQEIIMARLDQLGEAGKRTVQLASVIGRQFLVRLLERVSGLAGQLEGLLAELQSLEVIYRQGLLPEPAYIFKHAVIQDVAYNSLLLQRRRELHQAVGTAIEELYPERLAEHYEELAHHFDHGEVWLKAMEYGVLAGDRAAHAYANTEARAHYVRALRAAEHVTPSPEPGVIARIYVKYGQVLMVLGEYEEAVTVYQRALALVRQVGDRRGEVEILVWLSAVYDFSHQAEPAIEYNEQALTIARELGERGAQAICLANRVATRTAGYGQIIETTPDAEEALRLSREIGTLPLLAKTLVFLGGALQWRADFDRGLEYLHEGMQVADQAHAGFMFGYAAFHTGHAYLAKGEYEEALRLYQRLNEYACAAGDKFWMARAPNCTGGVHLELFSLDEAIQLNLEAEEVARQVWPWPEPRGHCLLKVGTAHFLRGAHGQAEEFFRRAWSLLEEDVWYRWRWHIPLLHARGELALFEGRSDEAWNYATESLALATQTDSRKHLARAQRLQGKILVVSGRLEDGKRYLETSLQLVTRLGVPQDIWRGKAALAKVQAMLGKAAEAEALLTQAVQTIETVADKLRTPSLHRSLLSADPVLEVYRTLGRRPPPQEL